MRLLLDTQVVLWINQQTLETRRPGLAARLGDANPTLLASVASLWEIAIKSRLDKLDPGMAIEEMAEHWESLGIQILPIDRWHAVASVDPEPPTKDPFDRLLLAQCTVEDLRLVTVDRALVDHPLAWRSD